MQKKSLVNIKAELTSKNKIIFGPFLGELGWEIMRWSGFVRKYKKDNPEKQILVATRESSFDLYYGIFSSTEILCYKIEEDYGKYSPNCYGGKGLDQAELLNYKNKLQSRYPDYYIFSPFEFGCNKRLVSFNDMDFNYSPVEDNVTQIESVIKKHPKKIPIAFASRDRQDMSSRNWGKGRWLSLMKELNGTDRYLIFNLGKSPGYVKAPDIMRNVINVEDIGNEYTSNIGLSIEAIKFSKMTIGSQSALIHLSAVLKIPFISWGHEKRRFTTEENIYNVKHSFIDCIDYVSVLPSTIIKELKNLS